MTTKTILKAAKRESTGKGGARKLRRGGQVPAVLYGKDMEPVSLSVDAHDAMHLFQAISVENTLVDLKVEGVREPFVTLVREIQTHPFKPDLVHIDFLRVQEGVAVELEVPVHLVGVPVGVKQEGGVLEQVIHELAVRCIPSNIPESIEVDVTGLELDDSIHVSDIAVGEGVEITIPPERVVCLVAMPRVVIEEVEEEEEGEELEGEAVLEGEGGTDEAQEPTEDEA